MAAVRVLIVEDHPDARDAYETYLSIEGFAVTTASSAAEAIRRAADGFDLIVTDLAMPGMDGMRFVAHMRADPETPPIPIVTISAQFGADIQRAATAVGSCHFLSAPFDPFELTAVLRRLQGACVHDCEHCDVRNTQRQRTLDAG